MSAHTYEDTGKILRQGADLETSDAAVLLIHGRGQSASSISELAERIELENIHWAAPQSPLGHWYGGLYNAPITENQADIDLAMFWFDSIINSFKHVHSYKKIAVIGFSQGACLALHYAWNRPKSCSIVGGLTGGLIGDKVPTYDHTIHNAQHGLLAYISSAKNDPWITEKSVIETQTAFRQAGATVHLNISEPRAHAVCENDVKVLRRLMERLF